MSSEKQQNLNSKILEIIQAKPIAFNPMLAKLAHSATAGLFMSQLLYWSGKGVKKNWEYKTIQQMYDETCLTRSEQDTAIKKWKALGVLEVQNKGIPQRRHFNVKTDKLISLLKSANKNAKSHKQSRGLRQTTTEITHKTTTNTESDDKKELKATNDFEPTNGEEARVVEIARELGEKHINYLLSIYKKLGLSLIERLNGEIKEKHDNAFLAKNKGAYFNHLVKKYENHEWRKNA